MHHRSDKSYGRGKLDGDRHEEKVDTSPLR
jgi:hypothetical protein